MKSRLVIQVTKAQQDADSFLRLSALKLFFNVDCVFDLMLKVLLAITANPVQE